MMQTRCATSRFCLATVPRSSLRATRHSKRQNSLKSRSHRLHVVATSEFWWEDEQEFDALTEVLLPKQVFVTTPAACQQHLEQLKSSTKFEAAFTAPALQEQAEELWQLLGRAGPPLFLKVRTRISLQDCAVEGPNSNAAAEQFWQEVTAQTWRTELDYGLASAKDATKAAADEQLLVIVASQRGVGCLVQAAVGADGSSSGATIDEGAIVVQFGGWNQGETQQQLTSYKQLRPHVQQMKVLQGS